MIWTLKRHIGTTVNVRIASVGMLQWWEGGICLWAHWAGGEQWRQHLDWADSGTPACTSLLTSPCWRSVDLLLMRKYHLFLKAFRISVRDFSRFHCKICGRDVTWIIMYICLFLQPRKGGHPETQNHLNASLKAWKANVFETIMTWLKQMPIRTKRNCYSGRRCSGRKKQIRGKFRETNNGTQWKRLVGPKEQESAFPCVMIVPLQHLIISTSQVLRKPESFSAHLLWSHRVQDTRRHHSSHWDSRNVLNVEYRWLQSSVLSSFLLFKYFIMWCWPSFLWFLCQADYFWWMPPQNNKLLKASKK